jgi:NAD-dependent histone deacetylase SIR2
MLIIMGTSLKVHGLKKLVKDFAKAVHASAPSSAASPPRKAKPWAGKVVFVNRTPPGSEWTDIIDYHVSGETDKWVDRVVEDWKKKRPADWQVQKTLDLSMQSPFKTVKDVTTAVAIKNKPKGMWGLIYFHDDGFYVVVGSKKVPSTEAENIPLVDDLFTSVDRASVPVRNLVTPPSSPSKRQQAASHYCDVESSPSKKRDLARCVSANFEERGLLFADSTNIVDNSNVDLQVEMIPKKGRSQTVKGTALDERARRKRGQTQTSKTKA